MAYDVEWTAGADMSSVISSLNNVEKSIGAMERAANRGFDRVADRANFAGRQVDKMMSLRFFSQAINSSQTFLVSALQTAAEESSKVRADLDKIEGSWSRLKGGIGMDLMTQTTGGGSATQVESWIDAAERARGTTVDWMADYFSAGVRGFKIITGDRAGAASDLADQRAGGAAGIRRSQLLDKELEKRQAIIKTIADAAKADEQFVKRSAMDDDGRGRFDAMEKYEKARAAAELMISKIGYETYSRREQAARSVLDIELRRLDVAKTTAMWAEQERRFAEEDADIREMITKDRMRARGLEAIGRDIMGGQIGTLKDLGMGREAERLGMRMQTADALDALSMRTDITDEDKTRLRGEMMNMWQWKKDALELGFMAEDAAGQRTVSSRGFSGGIAGANFGVSQAALAGSDPATRAAQQTASQTKEANRLLGEINTQLKKREAAVYR